MSHDNIIFECRQCGACCIGSGGNYVTEKDILAIADFLKISEEKMRRDFCEEFSQGTVLAISREGACVFQKENICSIHPVKPRMCREWPFIPAVLREPDNWQLMADACPGINPNAPREKVLEKTLDELKKTRPGFNWP